MRLGKTKRQKDSHDNYTDRKTKNPDQFEPTGRNVFSGIVSRAQRNVPGGTVPEHRNDPGNGSGQVLEQKKVSASKENERTAHR